MRRRQPPAPPGVTRYYGKCTGPGPWHLLPGPDCVPALCGRRAHYHGRSKPEGQLICRPCITVEHQQHRERMIPR